MAIFPSGTLAHGSRKDGRNQSLACVSSASFFLADDEAGECLESRVYYERAAPYPTHSGRP